MWDLPGPGFEPVSPALAGSFLTTGPPGKCIYTHFMYRLWCQLCSEARLVAQRKREDILAAGGWEAAGASGPCSTPASVVTLLGGFSGFCPLLLPFSMMTPWLWFWFYCPDSLQSLDLRDNKPCNLLSIKPWIIAGSFWQLGSLCLCSDRQVCATDKGTALGVTMALPPWS